ncbi:MAG: hypothetical protein ABL921_11625 [Pirellula sp.]
MLRFLAVSFFLLVPSFSLASDPHLLKKKSSWVWPDQPAVVGKVHTFLEERLSGNELSQAKTHIALEGFSAGVGLLDRVLVSTAKAESSIESLRQLIDGPFTPDSNSKMDSQLSSILANGSIPEWLKTDLQLICCRYQVQHSLFDEALSRLQPLAQETSSDPATWLFCMAVCQHHLLQRASCLETLDKLLERETELPTRYAITARLMQSDIKPLKEDSLDEIARLMNDVERRLALGRTGKTVRDKEQAIVDKLEKMIDKLEQQQQDQQKKQQQKNGGNSKGEKSQQSIQPMEDSQVAGAKGPGDVDQKNIGDGKGWGNLDPKQRLEAVQNITKDLPSHYREVIEAYFKRLATNPTQP